MIKEKKERKKRKKERKKEKKERKKERNSYLLRFVLSDW